MKALASVVVALSLLSIAACDSGDESFTMPTADALVGTWVNDDAGNTRAFEFAAGDAYTLYFYATGSAPAVAQHGTYAIAAGRLVTTVTDSPADPSLNGQQFGNDILGFDAKKLTLESTSSASGKRVFVKSSSL